MISLYYFLSKKHRDSAKKLVNLLNIAEGFSHLKVYRFSKRALVLRANFYYVENTTTKEYFKATKDIENMADVGVITIITCKNEEEMRAILAKNGSLENKQEPSIIQLMATKSEQRLNRIC